MYLQFPSLRLRVHLLAVPTLAVLLWVEGLASATILLSAALLHEAGHFLALKRYGVPVRRIDVEPMGITIAYRETDCSLHASAVITAAGPASNLLCALAAGLLLPFAKPEIQTDLGFFCFCNGFLAFLNLLPLERLDGGMLLRTILLMRFPTDVVYQVGNVVSIVFTLLLTASFLLLGVVFRFPLWTVLLSAVFLSRL